MIDKIKDTLRYRDARKYHHLNHVIKANMLNQTRERVQEVKSLLTYMVNQGIISIEGDRHLFLDTMDGQLYTNPDGTAAPTKYLDFDSVHIAALGFGEKIQAAEPLVVFEAEPAVATISTKAISKVVFEDNAHEELTTEPVKAEEVHVNGESQGEEVKVGSIVPDLKAPIDQVN